jgi:Ca2+-binding EF-hand superfamily protein
MKSRFASSTVLVATALVLCTADMALAYSQAEKNAFIKADANGDRKIAPHEFRTLIAELVAAGSEKAISVKKWGVYGYAFKRIDADKDGLITPAELQAQR